jgi:3-phosphoshikimate 1-carboxyvinyltransferase
MSHADATIRVRPGGRLAGSVGVPGDKSISHRALILGALADGATRVRHFLPAGDTRATLDCVRALGVTVEQHDETRLTVHGRGLHGLQAPSTPLNCVNAGTGIRLLAGVLAGQPFASVLDGSEQLRRRPMGRITAPLRQMGAQIADTDGCAPLHISPAHLHGMTYEMPVASAQVKSCLLLAGLLADDPTTIIEPGPARDHTERMLRAMGVDVQVDGGRVTITPADSLHPLDLTIPGDISSAAFMLAAAALAAAGSVTLQDIGVNPTRTGILDILAAMGVEIEQSNPRDEGGEPVADLVVQRGTLRGASIGGDWVVRAIDEFPALMAAAALAEGETIVSDAAELRIKETDRIAVMAGELRKLGAEIEERADGFRVIGPQKLRGTVVEGHDDHRVAMALAVAGLAAEGETLIHDAACVNDSFPGFVEALQSIGADVEWAEHD